jgi:hypothetical protein
MTDMSNNTDDFAADLEKFEEDFGETEIDERNHGDVPDGKYTAVVERAEVKKTKTTDQWMLAIMLRINSGKHSNRTLFKNYVFNGHPVGMKIFKTDMHTMGVTLNKIAEIKARCVDLLDLELEVQQKTKGENVNLYINKCGGKVEGGSSSGGDDEVYGGDDDDDIDF